MKIKREKKNEEIKNLRADTPFKSFNALSVKSPIVRKSDSTDVSSVITGRSLFVGNLSTTLHGPGIGFEMADVVTICVETVVEVLFVPIDISATLDLDTTEQGITPLDDDTACT